MTNINAPQSLSLSIQSPPNLHPLLTIDVPDAAFLRST